MGAGIVAVVVCLVAFGSFGCYAIVDDQIPVQIAGYSNIEVKKPQCENLSIVNVDKVAEEYNLSKEPKTYLEKIPHFNSLVYEIYETDDSIDDVLNRYEEELNSDGYSLSHSGSLSVLGIPLSYRGYLKQPLKVTAVGILASDSIPGHGTFVLYVTGLSTDLYDVVVWLQEQYTKLKK